MHVPFGRDRIIDKLTDPYMLWSPEFPEWLQSLKGRKEHEPQTWKGRVRDKNSAFYKEDEKWKDFVWRLISQQGDHLMASRSAVIFFGKDARTPKKPVD